MASREGTSPAEGVEDPVTSCVLRADWTSLQHLVTSGQLSDQQTAKAIVEMLKSGHVQEFTQHIRPFCSSAQLDSAMAELLSADLWSDACSLCQSVGREHQEWRLGPVLAHNPLLATVVEGRWKDLSRALQKDARLPKAEKRWACVQACGRAGQLEIIENVLPCCGEEDVDCVVGAVVSRGLWWVLGTLLSQRRVVSESVRVQAFKTAAEEATPWELSDFVLPHCTKRQLAALSSVLVRRKLWWTLGRLLKKDVAAFVECVVPAWGNADFDSFMSHLVSASQWQSVQQLLGIAGSGKHFWKIGDAILHRRIIQLTSEKQWSVLAYEVLQNGSAAVVAWMMEEVSKRAGKNEIMTLVVLMCPVQQIPSVLKNVVTRGFTKAAAKLLSRFAAEILELWAKANKSVEPIEQALWDLVNNHSYGLKTGVELLFEVREENSGISPLHQLLSKLVWNDLSFLQIIAAASFNQLLCQVLFHCTVHTIVLSLCGGPKTGRKAKIIDVQVRMILGMMLGEIRTSADSLPQQTQRLCTDLKPVFGNDRAPDPVYVLSFLRAVIKYCYFNGQWSGSTQALLSLLTTVPAVPEIQRFALEVMLREEKWSIIQHADLSYVGEQLRRVLFSSAVQQRQWSVVKQWADHSLSDDQRSWALQEACEKKQWDVCLRLAEHGLAEEERTRIHSTIATNAEMTVALDMYTHEADIVKVQKLLSTSSHAAVEETEEKQKQQADRVRQLEEVEAEVEGRMTSLQTLEAAVERGDWQLVLFTLRQESTPDQVSLAVKAAVAGGVWDVVRQLVRLGTPATDQQSLFLDMVTQQQWGVCTAMMMMTEQRLNLHLDMDTVLKLMEENQWSLLARLMRRSDCNVDDGVRRQVMQRAMRSKEGSVVSQCILGLTEPLSVQEREDLFHRAVVEDMLQAVLPLVAEKDDVGVRHRDTAALQAVQQQQWDVVDQCLLHHANIHQRDSEGDTAMDRAADSSDWDTVLALVKRGGDPSRLGGSGQSVIHAVIKDKKWDCAKQLIGHSAADLQQSARDEEDTRTPLELLMDAGREDIVQYALQLNRDQWRGVNSNGETTLHTLCRTGAHRLIPLLLQQGVSPLAVTPRGHTALSYAAFSRRLPHKVAARCISLGLSVHQPRITHTMQQQQLQQQQQQQQQQEQEWFQQQEQEWFQQQEQEWFQQQEQKWFLSPILLAVLRGMPVLTRMLFESGSCSFSELLPVLPHLHELADPDPEDTCSLTVAFEKEEDVINKELRDDTVEFMRVDIHLPFYPLRGKGIKKAAKYLIEVSAAPRSLKSLCRLTINGCLRISGSRESDVSQLPVSPGLREYILFSDLSALDEDDRDDTGDDMSDEGRGDDTGDEMSDEGSGDDRSTTDEIGDVHIDGVPLLK